MNTLVPTMIGFGVLCGLPILSFVAGAYVTRYGMPLQVRWRGWGGRDEGEED